MNYTHHMTIHCEGMDHYCDYTFATCPSIMIMVMVILAFHVNH